MEYKEILNLKGIGKSFPGVKALDDIDFNLAAGEVHALIGANGAGKSTLVNILAGVYQDYVGSISIEGRETKFASPKESLRAGISVIAQEFNLVDELSLSENIFLGNEPLTFKGLGILNRAQMHSRARGIFESFGVSLDPRIRVGHAGVAVKQLTEIGKALHRDTKILLMDEPTAALSSKEISVLYEVVNDLKNRGVAILYISHRFEDIYEVSDTVTVLRDGQRVFSGATKNTTAEELTAHMLGRAVVDEKRGVRVSQPQTLLEINGLTSTTLNQVSFKVNAGEVLGIVTGEGAKRSTLLRAVFGMEKSARGVFKVNGKHVKITSPQVAIEEGFGLLTEDRRQEGLFLDLSLAKNIVMPMLEKLSRYGFIDRETSDVIAKEKIEQLNIVATHPGQKVALLSGGNQQKAILARWLALDVDIYLLEEPTRGVDIGGKVELYGIIDRLKALGKCCILASSDVDELMRLCDRFLIMHKGEIVSILPLAEISKEKLLAHIMGEAE